jgi:subtilisin family serine protease
MVRHTSLILLLLSFLFIINPNNQLIAQVKKFGFDNVLKESPDNSTAFALPYSSENLSFLSSQGVKIKYVTPKWIYITATPKWINDQTLKGKIDYFYYDHSTPQVLADSARFQYHVNPVHAGTNGLDASYTGKDVIIGYVDQGIDFNHPDFRNSDGSSRVIRYWDHTLNSGGPASPYGYGIVWEETAINNGSCISTETGTAHGTTVAGIGSGNGLANGQNKGIAPESKIVIVESNFGLPNWTMTIADACDYIFKVADTLGMPAIVNLSLGTYLGSHDGNDPASMAIESLLDEKPGRIVVAAAGNSGAKGKYHVHGEAAGLDTSFVWILNNPSGTASFGANKIYFDLWSDATDATFEYAFGADRSAPNYGLRGNTIFRPAQTAINGVIFDTIYNSNGQRIATMEIYPEIIDDNYRMQVLFTNVDSTSYYYRFMTKGTGKYDMWSGSWLGLNDFVSSLPTVSAFPPIAFYQSPDTLQTIVSSWNCSEKVISVGNVRNRKGHTTKNNTYYTPSDLTDVGELSPNSSKGPNRHNVVKPDVSAGGDVSLASAPLWLLANASYNSVIEIGGWHARNGGTSMASPLVAGIAALYLQKCPSANYESFKNDLINTAFSDNYTGTVPNNAYGYGKPHALDLMLTTLFTAEISGDSEKCADSIPLLVNSSTTLSTVIWNNGSEGNPILVGEGGDFIAEAYDLRGCITIADTHEVIQLDVLPILPILQSGNVLATLSFTNYQWTLNGVDIPGANSQTYVMEPPYGTYTCYCVSDDGCISETPPLTIAVGIDESILEASSIYPNPTNDYFRVNTSIHYIQIQLFDSNGKEVELIKLHDGSFDISTLPKGQYHVVIYSDEQKIESKIVKM